ncbi:MAG: hypothetical protein Q9160_005813 [Pyrenula sp. 1 TL-2023]
MTRSDDNLGIETNDSDMPPYPYGPRQFFKQADTGLYGSSEIQFGNKISKGRNKGKTRRTWHPNVKLETVHSDALGRDLTLKITHACMRTIKKCGGLDQYLLGDKPARIKELGLLGWRLRWKIMNSPAMQQKYEAERANMGLPTHSYVAEPYDIVKVKPGFLEEVRAEQSNAWEKLREKDARFRSHIQRQWNRHDGVPWRIHPIVDAVPDISTPSEDSEYLNTSGQSGASSQANTLSDVKLDPLAERPEYGSALG